MIKLELSFTDEEAVRLFREVGLKVELKTIQQTEYLSHRPPIRRTYPTWIITNPHNGKEELLKDFFDKYLEIRKNELFLTADKLQIYNLFNNKEK